jgi:DUF1680 family protein
VSSADSEIYKLIEAMSWEVARTGSAAVRESLNRYIDIVAAAQESDGYLHTLFGRAWQRQRYSDFKWGHELYCFGHLIQAAVANHRATGATRLLAVATRLADHVCSTFGAGGMNQVCGHPEIEVALAELARETGRSEFLDQASLFLERRGTGTLPLFEFGAAFWQDDVPVRQATVLRGHAVRALYLAAGAVDIAVETGDAELLDALGVQWDATVAHRTYITGGMGSHQSHRAHPVQHRAASRVDAIRGTAGFERGPEVFALESADPPTYDGSMIRVDVRRRTMHDGRWPYGDTEPSGGGSERHEVSLVRYHEWDERGPSTMRVWIPTADEL